jgi:hypothetical protein
VTGLCSRRCGSSGRGSFSTTVAGRHSSVPTARTSTPRTSTSTHGTSSHAVSPASRRWATSGCPRRRPAYFFQSRVFLGVRRYEELLRAQNVPVAAAFEHSRLVAEHRARKLGLGIYLNGLAIAAAHHLGATAMIGTSGTKDGQARFHQRFGFQAVPGTRRYVEQYTEDVVISGVKQCCPQGIRPLQPRSRLGVLDRPPTHRQAQNS